MLTRKADIYFSGLGLQDHKQISCYAIQTTYSKTGVVWNYRYVSAGRSSIRYFQLAFM